MAKNQRIGAILAVLQVFAVLVLVCDGAKNLQIDVHSHNCWMNPAYGSCAVSVKKNADNGQNVFDGDFVQIKPMQECLITWSIESKQGNMYLPLLKNTFDYCELQRSDKKEMILVLAESAMKKNGLTLPSCPVMQNTTLRNVMVDYELMPPLTPIGVFKINTIIEDKVDKKRVLAMNITTVAEVKKRNPLAF